MISRFGGWRAESILTIRAEGIAFENALLGLRRFRDDRPIESEAATGPTPLATTSQILLCKMKKTDIMHTL